MSEQEWKVGERCQKVDYNSGEPVVSEGTIAELVMGTREKRGSSSYDPWNRSKARETEQYVEKVSVKWDDGKEETLSYYSVQPVDSELEREFRMKAPAVLDEIHAKLDEAHKALAQAEKIAEEHGIPFYASISPLGQGFTPESFQEKYGEVARDIVSDVTECGDNEYAGWKHSAVCY